MWRGQTLSRCLTNISLRECAGDGIVCLELATDVRMCLVFLVSDDIPSRRDWYFVPALDGVGEELFIHDVIASASSLLTASPPTLLLV